MRSQGATIEARYRVAIIGGGPAGSACALALAGQGLSDIVMLEADDYQTFRIGESLPPECRHLFQVLGIAQAFAREGHAACYGTCSYWGGDARGYNDSIMNPLGHGWHLDRCRFDRFLAMEARARGVQVRTGATLTASAPAAKGFVLDVLLATHNGRREIRIQADYVVDASGTRAVFARHRGRLKQGSDPLICLAARMDLVKTDSPPSTLTHLEAVEQGWWYGTHLPGGQLLLAFYSDATCVKSGQLQNHEKWSALLAASRHTAALARFARLPLSHVDSFPAPSYCLDQVGGEDWLAIGDAASAYDPIMSRGICKALANGWLAAQVIHGQSSLDHYTRTVRTAYQRYLALRHDLYGLERRWADFPFWRNIHAGGNSHFVSSAVTPSD